MKFTLSLTHMIKFQAEAGSRAERDEGGSRRRPAHQLLRRRQHAGRARRPFDRRPRLPAAFHDLRRDDERPVAGDVGAARTAPAAAAAPFVRPLRLRVLRG